MKEDILQFLWKHRRFNHACLTTIQGEKIEILSPGLHNPNSGPDFLNARIRINNTEWAGHVEIHVHGSDWKKHGHASDSAYDNVILHVVYFHDEQAYNGSMQPLPTLELMGKVNPYDLERCDTLLEKDNDVPCFPEAKPITTVYKRAAMERALVQRLEERSTYIQASLEKHGQDWEQLTFETIARSFGFGVNNICFEETAKSIKINTVHRIAAEPFQAEALLFGQAGLLPVKSVHGYPQLLIREYKHLQHAHGLFPLQLDWKFARTHPQNFPTLRMAQLAAVLFHVKNLFSTLKETEKITDVINLFIQPVSDYWKNHFSFTGNVQTNRINQSLGEKSAQGIVINAVVPLLFTYARINKAEALEEKTLRWLTELPPEHNTITRKYVGEADFPNVSAGDSQGILQLYKHACLRKKCLNCQVGHQLLGKAEEPVVGYEVM
ncbi:MAG: DUF2851 family protein [Flavobacteriales bacterium]